MRKMVFIFFLLPILGAAQRPEVDIAYVKSFRPELGKPLLMPEIDFNPDFIIENQYNPRQRQMHYPVTSDSAYRKIYFRYIYTADSLKKYEQKGADSFALSVIKKYQIDSLKSFDFNAYNLIIYSACGQCLANCNHGKGDESCHRNACFFRYTWFMVVKPKKLAWD
jgi:hypothetical protein